MVLTPLMGKERETGIMSSPLFQEKCSQDELSKILSLCSLASDWRERGIRCDCFFFGIEE